MCIDWILSSFLNCTRQTCRSLCCIFLFVLYYFYMHNTPRYLNLSEGFLFCQGWPGGFIHQLCWSNFCKGLGKNVRPCRSVAVDELKESELGKYVTFMSLCECAINHILCILEAREFFFGFFTNFSLLVREQQRVYRRVSFNDLIRSDYPDFFLFFSRPS